jgi:hypothetical protein
MSARRPDSSRCDVWHAAPRHHLLLWASLRWTRRLVIWRARKWQGVLCVQPYWITCGWLISRRCRQPTRNALRADQGGFQCLLIQGRCPAEYLALLPSHTARVITSARSGKLRDGFAIGSENGVAHAFVHALWSCTKRYHGCRCAPDAAVPPWRRTLPSSRIRILVRVWTGMRPRMVLSILSEWEDKPSRETKVLYWNAVATLFRPLAEACKDSSDDEDDGSGLEDSSY